MVSLGALKALSGASWAPPCTFIRGNQPTDGQGNFRNLLWGTSLGHLGVSLAVLGPS